MSNQTYAERQQEFLAQYPPEQIFRIARKATGGEDGWPIRNWHLSMDTAVGEEVTISRELSQDGGFRLKFEDPFFKHYCGFVWPYFILEPVDAPVKTSPLTKLLKAMRRALLDGRLPGDWHTHKERVVLKRGGVYPVVFFDCEDDDEGQAPYRRVDGSLVPSDQCTWDEVNEEYILEEDAVYAIIKDSPQDEGITAADNCLEIVRPNRGDPDFIHEQALGCGYVRLRRSSQAVPRYEVVYVEDQDYYDYVDNAYCWEDGYWYSYDEPSQSIFGYHKSHGNWRNFTTFATRAKVGYEIEKNEDADFHMSATDLLEDTGFSLEEDSSVDEGFELVSPTFDLFEENLIDRFKPVADLVNKEDLDGAGGHIHLSVAGYDDQELLDAVSGFLPIILAMYRHRADTTYCKSKPLGRLKNDGEKYQAVAMHRNRIEFRIISAVRDMKQLEWRIELMRAVVNNLNRSFEQIAIDLLTPGSNLNVLFRGKGAPYTDTKRLIKMMEAAITMNDMLHNQKVTAASVTAAINKYKGASAAPKSLNF